LERELRRAERFSKPLSIMLVDVDHFKPYNDRMGHLMGDEALKQIAKCLQTSVRKIDGVSRFGGEEFCLVLPETSPEAAKEVAKKLNEAIKKLDIKGAKEQPLGYLSVSIGISWFPKTEAKDLFDQADRALYAAKNQGRDRTVLYGG
ncbi:MAG: GGDEF domain-containing protein, partial [Deltaproteobacteria bacterium]|nr:GGDEF domain-containing protein [Deltaproteobacteria bacterium]